MSRKILEGVVLKKSSDKTISVEVKRKYLHKTLHKSVTSSRKYLVHDQDNCAAIGENVKIIEVKVEFSN